LRSRKNTSIEAKIDILHQVAKGLQCMHQCNIAHMDLKLENIIRFGDGFKLIDLESSIDFNNEVDEDINIKSSLSIMSPELYLFEVTKLGTSVDIWS